MKDLEMLIERIVSEINEEIDKLLNLKSEYQEFLKKYPQMDKYLLRTKASYLADFYIGVERIFKIIAEEINGGLPKGENWHKRLLLDMSLKIGQRTPVISKVLYENLLKFLGFRHVVRHIYGFELNENRLNELADIYESVLEGFIKEMEMFCNSLRSRLL